MPEVHRTEGGVEAKGSDEDDDLSGCRSPVTARHVNGEQHCGEEEEQIAERIEKHSPSLTQLAPLQRSMAVANVFRIQPAKVAKYCSYRLLAGGSLGTCCAS